VLPPLCASCRAPTRAEDEEALCPACRVRLPWLANLGCRLCGDAEPLRDETLCSNCVRKRGRRSPLLACTAALAFEGEAERWIYRIKYPVRGLGGLDPGARAVLRDWTRACAARAPGPLPDWIVPVPLHPRRLRERGFNPAALIARELARETGAHFAPRALVRLRDTPSQTGLDRAGRRRNVEGAFACRKGLWLPDSLWLVDDVVTTRSTLEASARALRRAGAKRIAAVCLARAR